MGNEYAGLLLQDSIKGVESWEKSKDFVLFDLLLRKFINPNLDLLSPPGVNVRSKIWRGNSLQVCRYASTSKDFWEIGSGGNFPALTSSSKDDPTVGWAGQVLSKPESNPRPEHSNIEPAIEAGGNTEKHTQLPLKGGRAKEKEKSNKYGINLARSGALLYEGKTERKRKGLLSKSLKIQKDVALQNKSKNKEWPKKPSEKHDNVDKSVNVSQKSEAENKIDTNKLEEIKVNSPKSDKSTLIKKIYSQVFVFKKTGRGEGEENVKESNLEGKGNVKKDEKLPPQTNPPQDEKLVNSTNSGSGVRNLVNTVKHHENSQNETSNKSEKPVENETVESKLVKIVKECKQTLGLNSSQSGKPVTEGMTSNNKVTNTLLSPKTQKSSLKNNASGNKKETTVKEDKVSQTGRTPLDKKLIVQSKHFEGKLTENIQGDRKDRNNFIRSKSDISDVKTMERKLKSGVEHDKLTSFYSKKRSAQESNLVQKRSEGDKVLHRSASFRNAEITNNNLKSKYEESNEIKTKVSEDIKKETSKANDKPPSQKIINKNLNESTISNKDFVNSNVNIKNNINGSDINMNLQKTEKPDMKTFSNNENKAHRKEIANTTVTDSSQLNINSEEMNLSVKNSKKSQEKHQSVKSKSQETKPFDSETCHENNKANKSIFNQVNQSSNPGEQLQNQTTTSTLGVFDQTNLNSGKVQKVTKNAILPTLSSGDIGETIKSHSNNKLAKEHKESFVSQNETDKKAENVQDDVTIKNHDIETKSMEKLHEISAQGKLLDGIALEDDLSQYNISNYKGFKINSNSDTPVVKKNLSLQSALESELENHGSQSNRTENTAGKHKAQKKHNELKDSALRKTRSQMTKAELLKQQEQKEVLVAKSVQSRGAVKSLNDDMVNSKNQETKTSSPELLRVKEDSSKNNGHSYSTDQPLKDPKILQGNNTRFNKVEDFSKKQIMEVEDDKSRARTKHNIEPKITEKLHAIQGKIVDDLAVGDELSQYNISNYKGFKTNSKSDTQVIKKDLPEQSIYRENVESFNCHSKNVEKTVGKPKHILKQLKKGSLYECKKAEIKKNSSQQSALSVGHGNISSQSKSTDKAEPSSQATKDITLQKQTKIREDVLGGSTNQVIKINRPEQFTDNDGITNCSSVSKGLGKTLDIPSTLQKSFGLRNDVLGGSKKQILGKNQTEHSTVEESSVSDNNQLKGTTKTLEKPALQKCTQKSQNSLDKSRELGTKTTFPNKLILKENLEKNSEKHTVLQNSTDLRNDTLKDSKTKIAYSKELKGKITKEEECKDISATENDHAAINVKEESNLSPKQSLEAKKSAVLEVHTKDNDKQDKTPNIASKEKKLDQGMKHKNQKAKFTKPSLFKYSIKKSRKFKPEKLNRKREKLSEVSKIISKAKLNKQQKSKSVPTIPVKQNAINIKKDNEKYLIKSKSLESPNNAKTSKKVKPANLTKGVRSTTLDLSSKTKELHSEVHCSLKQKQESSNKLLSSKSKKGFKSLDRTTLKTQEEVQEKIAMEISSPSVDASDSNKKPTISTSQKIIDSLQKKKRSKVYSQYSPKPKGTVSQKVVKKVVETKSSPEISRKVESSQNRREKQLDVKNAKASSISRSNHCSKEGRFLTQKCDTDGKNSGRAPSGLRYNPDTLQHTDDAAGTIQTKKKVFYSKSGMTLNRTRREEILTIDNETVAGNNSLKNQSNDINTVNVTKKGLRTSKSYKQDKNKQKFVKSEHKLNSTEIDSSKQKSGDDVQMNKMKTKLMTSIGKENSDYSLKKEVSWSKAQNMKISKDNRIKNNSNELRDFSENEAPRKMLKRNEHKSGNDEIKRKRIETGISMMKEKSRPLNLGNKVKVPHRKENCISTQDIVFDRGEKGTDKTLEKEEQSFKTFESVNIKSKEIIVKINKLQQTEKNTKDPSNAIGRYEVSNTKEQLREATNKISMPQSKQNAEKQSEKQQPINEKNKLSTQTASSKQVGYSSKAVKKVDIGKIITNKELNNPSHSNKKEIDNNDKDEKQRVEKQLNSANQNEMRVNSKRNAQQGKINMTQSNNSKTLSMDSDSVTQSKIKNLDDKESSYINRGNLKGISKEPLMQNSTRPENKSIKTDFPSLVKSKITSILKTEGYSKKIFIENKTIGNSAGNTKGIRLSSLHNEMKHNNRISIKNKIIPLSESKPIKILRKDGKITKEFDVSPDSRKKLLSSPKTDLLQKSNINENKLTSQKSNHAPRSEGRIEDAAFKEELKANQKKEDQYLKHLVVGFKIGNTQNGSTIGKDTSLETNKSENKVEDSNEINKQNLEPKDHSPEKLRLMLGSIKSGSNKLGKIELSKPFSKNDKKDNKVNSLHKAHERGDFAPEKQQDNKIPKMSSLPSKDKKVDTNTNAKEEKKSEKDSILLQLSKELLKQTKEMNDNVTELDSSYQNERSNQNTTGKEFKNNESNVQPIKVIDSVGNNSKTNSSTQRQLLNLMDKNANKLTKRTEKPGIKQENNTSNQQDK